MIERAVRIERAGLHSLVVDRGRFGFRDRGVGWCGASDLLAYTMAQRLVGNVDGTSAAIEIVMGGMTVVFDVPAVFALAGADCAAELDGAPVQTWASHAARSGSRLVLNQPRTWMRTILAIDGGIDVPLVLGSRTTDCVASMGGYDGRPLRAGDRLALGASSSPRPASVTPPNEDFAAEAWSRNELGLRIVSQPGFDAVWGAVWSVGHESNRMGYRLRGAAVPHELGSIRSQAVFPGFVQLPPSGEPIVLMEDAPTTGGYPIAGVVIEADLWMLAQARIDAKIRFVPCDLDEAQRASERIREYVGGSQR